MSTESPSEVGNLEEDAPGAPGASEAPEHSEYPEEAQEPTTSEIHDENPYENAPKPLRKPRKKNKKTVMREKAKANLTAARKQKNLNIIRRMEEPSALQIHELLGEPSEPALVEEEDVEPVNSEVFDENRRFSRRLKRKYASVASNASNAPTSLEDQKEPSEPSTSEVQAEKLDEDAPGAPEAQKAPEPIKKMRKKKREVFRERAAQFRKHRIMQQNRKAEVLGEPEIRQLKEFLDERLVWLKRKIVEEKQWVEKKRSKILELEQQVVTMRAEVEKEKLEKNKKKR